MEPISGNQLSILIKSLIEYKKLWKEDSVMLRQIEELMAQLSEDLKQKGKKNGSFVGIV